MTGAGTGLFAPLVDPERVLVAVITGGRPALSERPTLRLLDRLSAAGYPHIEWVVREDHAPDYDVSDGRPLNVYTKQFASTYARAHWRHPRARWAPDGFFGAFPGREHVMRSAEARGFRYVLQLDDNVTGLSCAAAGGSDYGERVADMTPDEALGILLGLAASTNAAMCGMQLTAVVPEPQLRVIRPGYPYSVFVETVTPYRVPYFGPFEDDVMHALDYALSATPVTAAVVPSLLYIKESKSKTGMRKHYNVERGLGLVQHFPQNAKLTESRRSASVADTERGIRHVLNTKGFTPVQVTDMALYTRSVTALRLLNERAFLRMTEHRRKKIRRRGGLESLNA